MCTSLALILLSFNGIHTNIYSSRTKFSTLFKPKFGLNDSNQIKNLVSGQRSRSMSDRTPPTVGVQGLCLAKNLDLPDYYQQINAAKVIEILRGSDVQLVNE